MLAVKLERLPDVRVQRILIFRTARAPQVQCVIEQLRAQYPTATFAVLGTQLKDNALFDGMKKFEIQGAWLKLSSVRRFERDVRNSRFDMTVMVLNGDGSTGYEDVSRVMKRIPATTRLVAGYDRRWYAWNHSAFSSGFFLYRWFCNATEYLLFAFVFIYMLVKSSKPSYMPNGQGRPAPEYEK